MVSEVAFVESALQGIAISMSFAFIILIATTKNVILAFFAVYCVGLIVVSVVCIIVLKGWELGVSEAVSVVILIGLSVDYVVHLAADFAHSKYKSRNDKMNQAYQEMGVSILSGMITTAGSGGVLFMTVFLTF